MGSQCLPGQDPGQAGRQLGGCISEHAAAISIGGLQPVLDRDDAGSVEGSELGGRGTGGWGVGRG